MSKQKAGTKKSVGIDLSEFTPYAPVTRAGHWDHIPSSLQPKDAGTDLAPSHPLEKSSSSLLHELATPPSTPSEEEAGTIGIHIPCLYKKPHRVDHRLQNPKVSKKFGCILLIIAIVSNIPALIGAILYIAWSKIRSDILWHYNRSLILFFVFFLLNFVLKYFSGLCRHPPFHVMMIFSKSIVFAAMYTLVTGGMDYIFILQQMQQDPRYSLIDGGETKSKITWEDLYHSYVMNEDNEVLTKVVEFESQETEELVHNKTFLAGIIYALFLLILLLVLVKFTKVDFFGPIFPFISYTLTFASILFLTIAFMNQWFGSLATETLLWELVQSIIGPFIGAAITETFIMFLDNLIHGKLCPLRQGEFLYAAAHY